MEMEFDYSYMPRNRYMLFFGLQVSSASLSMIGSITIIYLILKQRKSRCEVYHRLLLALSIADIVFDISIILQFVAVRADTEHPLAMGNIQTCSTVGFFTTFGFSTVNLYFVVLSIYFLLTLRYRKHERQVKALIEPYGHLFAIGLPFTICTAALLLEAFNPVRIFPTCFMRPYPTNCLWDDDVPCQRGGGASKLFAVMLALVFITMLTGIACTWMVYWTVRQQQKRNVRHSFGGEIQSSQRQRVRQVARQAFWYTLVFVNGILASIFSSSTESVFAGGINTRGEDGHGDNLVNSTVIAVLSTIYMFACPLQGVLNLIIYLWPGFKAWRQLGHTRRFAVHQALSGRAALVTNQTRQWLDGNANESVHFDTSQHVETTEASPSGRSTDNGTRTSVEILPPSPLVQSASLEGTILHRNESFSSEIPSRVHTADSRADEPLPEVLESLGEDAVVARVYLSPESNV